MSDDDQMVNSSQTRMLSLIEGPDLRQGLRMRDFTAIGDQHADLPTGLVSLAFIRAAIRRSVRFLIAMAVSGLLIGVCLYIAYPPAYQASTTVLLTFGPYENPTTTAIDASAIVESRSVAGTALHKLGVKESVGSFVATYTATVVSDRVLLITVNGLSSNDAVRRANAVAAAFLQFRASQLDNERDLMIGAAVQQVTRARQKASSISKQISQLQAQPPSPAQQARLGRLQTERSQAEGKLATLEQNANAGQATASSATTLAVKGSKVLDAASPLPHSRLKPPLFDAGIGLGLGLALAVGIVVVQALVSDRLRRRDDVAHALGAPVKLSVGTVRLSRWAPARRGLEAARATEVQRIAAYLRSAIPPSPGGAATLAVVAVDEPRVAALSLVALAGSCAQEGRQVVVADLCPGAPAAMILDAKGSGVRVVHVNGAHLVIAVPDGDGVFPAGPLDRTSQAQHSPFAEAVTAATASADLLLTLATVDPALGGEHLSAWATTAVAVVTAGKSSATRVHAVGEMIRLGGTRLDSAVLIGADKTDESLGVTHAPGDYLPDRARGS